MSLHDVAFRFQSRETCLTRADLCSASEIDGLVWSSHVGSLVAHRCENLRTKRVIIRSASHP
jgi:hypothetical protein